MLHVQYKCLIHFPRPSVNIVYYDRDALHKLCITLTAIVLPSYNVIVLGLLYKIGD